MKAEELKVLKRAVSMCWGRESQPEEIGEYLLDEFSKLGYNLDDPDFDDEE